MRTVKSSSKGHRFALSLSILVQLVMAVPKYTDPEKSASEVLLRRYAAVSNSILLKENVEQELQIQRETTQDLETSLPDRHQRMLDAMQATIKAKQALGNLESIFSIRNMEQKRAKLRSDLAIAQQNEKEISHAFRNHVESVHRGQIVADHLKAELNSLRSLQKDLAEIVSKIFVLHPDHEEAYYSTLLANTINQFYRVHCDSSRLLSAIHNVDRTFKRLKFDQLHKNAFYTPSLDEIQLAMEFLDVAKSYWTCIKKIPAPAPLPPLSRTYDECDRKALSHHVHSLFHYFLQLQQFLEREEMRVLSDVKSTAAKLDEVSDKLMGIRFRVLESRLSAAAFPDGGMVQGREGVTCDQLLPRNLEYLFNVSCLKVVARNEEEIADAVGYKFIDPELQEIIEAPPSYDAI
ncbi:hypothetical protein BC830DRAFT_1146253 [Chytriomyces sp. MP71]|nr:hypothetical protein BC830DRAFT_1146253 [Chytriomyces sp. MP71]